MNTEANTETNTIIRAAQNLIRESVRYEIRDYFSLQMKANAEKKLLTINQVRKRLGKAHKTVSRMIERSELKATIDGKYVSEAEVERYLNE
jgi:IS30 family transposase